MREVLEKGTSDLQVKIQPDPFRGICFLENDKSMNDNFYSKAIKEALKVEFLTNREELFLYAGALYSAMMWSREVNEKNRVILKKNKYVK